MSSTNLTKKTQELAEDKAENKFEQTLTENIKPQSLVIRNSFSYGNASLLQNRWAAVLPPGGLQNISIFCGFEGSGGAWGHHQSTLDEKTRSGFYFRELWLDL